MASIDVTRDGDIATVALNNPGKLNALTIAMWRELARVMHELSADDALRCIVLRGAGAEAFAAGADLEEFTTERATLAQAKTYHHDYVHGVLKAVGECRHPTVALIQGACVGGGLEIACNCDLRISGESGRFGVPINRLGFAIAYSELAGLLALAGRAVAAEILLEGRVWKADEAHAKGLAHARRARRGRSSAKRMPRRGASPTAHRSSRAGTKSSSAASRRARRR